MTCLLQGRGISFRYGDSSVLENVDVALGAGEFVGLVGPNGAGKTTLLHTLLGILRPAAGSILLGGDDVAKLDRAEVARRAALVPQEIPSDFALTVREVVAMGRTPYIGRFRVEGPKDSAAVDGALEVTETTSLGDRFLNELSGGERQRVHIARALAQETPTLMLDEPTANLDVAHQLSLMDLLCELVRRGKCALAALHDLSLAARYCDRILLLADKRLVAEGRPEEVLTRRNLAEYFGIDARVERDEAGFLLIVPLAAAKQIRGSVVV